MTELLESGQWATIRERVLQRGKSHKPRADSVLYNGGTVVVLACTSAAAFLYPVDLGGLSFLPPLLSGVAAFLVAMERALNFGERWRWQLAMKASYDHVVDLIDFVVGAGAALPADERKVYERDILKELHSLCRREGMVPGTGGAPEDPLSQR